VGDEILSISTYPARMLARRTNDYDLGGVCRFCSSTGRGIGRNRGKLASDSFEARCGIYLATSLFVVFRTMPMNGDGTPAIPGRTTMKVYPTTGWQAAWNVLRT